MPVLLCPLLCREAFDRSDICSGEVRKMTLLTIFSLIYRAIVAVGFGLEKEGWKK